MRSEGASLHYWYATLPMSTTRLVLLAFSSTALVAYDRQEARARRKKPIGHPTLQSAKAHPEDSTFNLVYPPANVFTGRLA